MAEVGASEAARLTGKGRATIQRHIKSGKLSARRVAAHGRVIDTAELERVYGSIRIGEAPQAEPVSQTETVTVEVLREQLRIANELADWLKGQLEAEQKRSRELECPMLPPGKATKGFFRRLFGG